MKIWLDDVRPEPEWPADRQAPYNVVCTTAMQAIALIAMGDITYISFDHDLGEGPTGYDVAKFIEEGAHVGMLRPISYKIHSANPVGAANITMAMDSAWNYWREKYGVQPIR